MAAAKILDNKGKLALIVSVAPHKTLSSLKFDM